MLDGLKKGDKVITNGGLLCKVVKPEENFIKVSLNDSVIVKVSKEYIAKKIDE
jgi:preprotein translocase subunit YajC